MTATDLRTITLVDLPVRPFLELQHHQEEMLREFALIDVDRERGGAAGVPARLLELVTDLRTRYAVPRGAIVDAVDEAARRGDETVTVTVSFPAEAASQVKATCDAYEEADEYCRSGDLLTLATSAEVTALRRRLCDDIVAQLTA